MLTCSNHLFTCQETPTLHVVHTDCQTGQCTALKYSFYSTVIYVIIFNNDKDCLLCDICFCLRAVQECLPCHLVCDECYGPTSGHCVECTGYQEVDDCVESCSSDFYADEQSRTCGPCDHQCLECHGATAADCISCRNLKLYDDVEGHTVDTPVSHISNYFNMGHHQHTACLLDVFCCYYIRQVNGVKLADILFSLLSFCLSVCMSVRMQYSLQQCVSLAQCISHVPHATHLPPPTHPQTHLGGYMHFLSAF